MYSNPRSSLNKTAPPGTTEELPFNLDKAGFTTNDLLIWELNFGTSAIDPRQLENFGPAINILDNLSEQIINASHAKIVILSGLNPQQFFPDHLIQSGRISAPLNLHLESLSMTFYAAMCDNNVRRILMNARQLTNVSNAKGWGRFCEMSGIFKAVSMLLGYTSIIYRFYERSRARNQIFDLSKRERAGESLDVESLGEPVREWLSDRGFRTREDLNELAEIGGGLGRSLYTLVVVLNIILARVPKENRFEKFDWPQIKWRGGHIMPKESLIAMDKLLRQKLEEVRALRLSLTSTDHHVPNNKDHGTGYAVTDEQDNIEIELLDADTVFKADTSVRAPMLEAQMDEELESPGEILMPKSPEAGESDLESDHEDFESRGPQHQMLQNHSTRLKKRY